MKHSWKGRASRLGELSIAFAAVALAGCGGGGIVGSAGVTCGPGTTLRGTVCELNAADGGTLTCGPGTMMVNGACVAAGGDAGPGTTCGAGTVLMNGVCVATPGDGGAVITCGVGTMLMNGMCVPAPSDGGPTTTCGAGTVLGDGGACVPAPSGPSLDSVSVDHLSVRYDTTQPIFVGHRLPLRIGVTSRAMTPPAAPVPTQVVVSLIEHFNGTPNPTQAMALRQCVVGSFVAELSGANVEQQLTPELIIPRECVPAGATSVTYNLVVQFDDERVVLPESSNAAFVFTQALRTSGPNAACRSSFDMAATADGCVHQLRVEASPGVDIEPTVEASSNVAILWLPEENAPTAPAREMLSLLIDERAFGRDPYVITDPAASMLPGDVTLRVRMAPATGARAGEYLPLQVQAATAGMNPVDTRTINRLQPASDNRAEYSVFPSDAVFTAVEPGGNWANVDEFTLETCLVSDFVESGNLGEYDGEDELAGDGDAESDNCQRTTVLGVRALPATASASRVDLNRDWSNRWGNDKLALNASLTTQTSAFVGGASTDTNANVNITSKYLPDISIARARAYAGLDLFNPSATGMEFWVDVLGLRLYSYERRVPGTRELYSRDWNIMRRVCRDKTVMISIVPVSVEACAQGTVGLNVSLGLYRDGDIMGDRRFPMANTEGQIAATARPYANAGASASVSINLGIARGGVEGNLSIIEIGAPFIASANVGLTRMNTMTMRPSAQANINFNWTLETRGLNGSVTLFADTRGIQWCRRWGFAYPCGITWDRRGEFNLFSFGADTERSTLLNRSFGNVNLAP